MQMCQKNIVSGSMLSHREQGLEQTGEPGLRQSNAFTIAQLKNFCSAFIRQPRLRQDQCCVPFCCRMNSRMPLYASSVLPIKTLVNIFLRSIRKWVG